MSRITFGSRLSSVVPLLRIHTHGSANDGGVLLQPGTVDTTTLTADYLTLGVPYAGYSSLQMAPQALGPTSAGTHNDYNPNGTGNPFYQIVANLASGTATITGLDNSWMQYTLGTGYNDGVRAAIVNQNDGLLVLSDNNSGSAFGNRFDFGYNVTLRRGQGCELYYDDDNSVWRLLALGTVPYYAEGTWTPALSFGGASTGITYSSQTGAYRRVGSLVYVAARLILTSKGSAAGIMAISGLPFNVVTLLQPVTVGYYANMAGLSGHLAGIVQNTTLDVRQGGAISMVILTDANFTNTTNLYVGATYGA